MSYNVVDGFLMAYMMMRNWRIYFQQFCVVHQQGVHMYGHKHIHTHNTPHAHTVANAIGKNETRCKQARLTPLGILAMDILHLTYG